MIFTTSSLPTCPLREEKSFSQRAFSIYTDIRKLQDKAKTSYIYIVPIENALYKMFHSKNIKKVLTSQNEQCIFSK